MLSDDQVDRILVGLDDMTDRGLLGREKAADLTDRVHRVGPEARDSAPALVRRWWREQRCH